MAINPNGAPQGYYPPQGAYPTSYPQGVPQTGYVPPMGGPDMYSGVQAAPPGQGLAGGMQSLGGSMGGIFGVIGGLINSIISLVTSVITGVINLVMSVVKAILSPILGLFGIGNKDKQQAKQQQQQAQQTPQVPLYNQAGEQAMQKADQTLSYYRQQVQAAQTNQQTASTTNWFQLMQKADADFQAQRQELARIYGPTSQQVQMFDSATAQVKADMQALAGGSGGGGTAPAATPGDLSQLQLPNDENTLQVVRNLQLLMACPAKIGELTAANRAEVDTASTQMQQQIQQLQSSNPTLANQLMGFYTKFQQDWAAAKAASPNPPAGNTPAPNPTDATTGSAGRKYRDIPMELPDTPAPTGTKTTVPSNLGGE